MQLQKRSQCVQPKYVTVRRYIDYLRIHVHCSSILAVVDLNEKRRQIHRQTSTRHVHFSEGRRSFEIPCGRRERVPVAVSVTHSKYA